MKLLFLFSPEMNRQPKTNANPYKNSHPIYDVIKKALKYFWIFQKKNEEKKNIYEKSMCIKKPQVISVSFKVYQYYLYFILKVFSTI